MIDSEALKPVLMDGLLAAFIAIWIHGLTADYSPPRFRLFPTHARERTGYWFRTLMLVLSLSAVFFTQRYIHPVLWVAGAVAAILLLASAAACWQTDKDLCKLALLLCLLAMLRFVLTPSIS